MSVEAATATGIEELNTSMNAFMGGLQAQLGKSLEPLKEISVKIGGSKFGKNIKAFGSSIKGLGKSNFASWKLEQLMKLIEPFMNLLKLLEIPINALSMLLQMFVNEIFVALLPFFLEFSLLLLELAPVFKILGQIVGKLLSEGLNWLIESIGKLWEKFKGLVAFLGDKQVPILDRLKAAFKAVWKILEIFHPALILIRLAFGALKKAWEDSGGKIFGKDGFIALGFRALMDVAKNIVNSVIQTINNIITKINDIVGTSFGTIPMLAKGGITTGPTLAMIGDNPGGVERVQPLENGGFGKEAQLLAASEETNRLLNVLVKQNLDAERWRMRS